MCFQARLKAELNSSTFCAIPVIAHPLCGWPRLRVGSLRKAAAYATLASIHNHVVQTRYRPEVTGRPIATNQRNPSINVPHLSLYNCARQPASGTSEGGLG